MFKIWKLENCLGWTLAFVFCHAAFCPVHAYVSRLSGACLGVCQGIRPQAFPVSSEILKAMLELGDRCWST